jgi:hypothetical protein
MLRVDRLLTVLGVDHVLVTSGALLNSVISSRKRVVLPASPRALGKRSFGLVDAGARGARARDRSAVEGAEPGDTLKVRERVLAGVTQAYRGGLFLTSVCQIA